MALFTLSCVIKDSCVLVYNQAFNGMTICYGGTNPCHSEYSNSEEILGSKIGQYTLEERKERLHRYRQKRNERNFSKKIKVNIFLIVLSKVTKHNHIIFGKKKHNHIHSLNKRHYYRQVSQ